MDIGIVQPTRVPNFRLLQTACLRRARGGRPQQSRALGRQSQRVRDTMRDVI